MTLLQVACTNYLCTFFWFSKLSHAPRFEVPKDACKVKYRILRFTTVLRFFFVTLKAKTVRVGCEFSWWKFESFFYFRMFIITVVISPICLVCPFVCFHRCCHYPWINSPLVTSRMLCFKIVTTSTKSLFAITNCELLYHH